MKKIYITPKVEYMEFQTISFLAQSNLSITSDEYFGIGFGGTSDENVIPRAKSCNWSSDDE